MSCLVTTTQVLGSYRIGPESWIHMYGSHCKLLTQTSSPVLFLPNTILFHSGNHPFHKDSRRVTSSLAAWTDLISLAYLLHGSYWWLSLVQGPGIDYSPSSCWQAQHKASAADGLTEKQRELRFLRMVIEPIWLAKAKTSWTEWVINNRHLLATVPEAVQDQGASWIGVFLLCHCVMGEAKQLLPPNGRNEGRIHPS